MKYAVLLEAKSELSGPVVTLLDQAIFVPRAEAFSSSCGGIMLFKNISGITQDKQFCERTFGKTFNHVSYHCLSYIILLLY